MRARACVRACVRVCVCVCVWTESTTTKSKNKNESCNNRTITLRQHRDRKNDFCITGDRSDDVNWHVNAKEKVQIFLSALRCCCCCLVVWLVGWLVVLSIFIPKKHIFLLRFVDSSGHIQIDLIFTNKINK